MEEWLATDFAEIEINFFGQRKDIIYIYGRRKESEPKVKWHFRRFIAQASTQSSQLKLDAKLAPDKDQKKSRGLGIGPLVAM